MKDIAARIRLARVEARYPNATKAAQAFGWTVSTYLGYENGDRAPSRDAVIRVAKAFGVRLDWLLTGRGDMRPGKGEPRELGEFDVAKAFDQAPAGVQRIIERILTDAGAMTDEEKRSLAAPEVPYAQEEKAMLPGLQDRPRRMRGAPGDDAPTIDQKAIDEALKHLPKRKPKRRGQPVPR